MSYGIISILLIGSLRSPPPFRLLRTSPYAGGRIGRSMLSCRDMAPWLSIHSPTTKWGERWWRQPPKGGCISDARRAVVKVLAAKGGIKNGAEGAVPPQWNGTSYLPRAEPSTRPEGVSRSRTEPLAPRAKGPAAPSTLARESGRQPSGILESTAPVPVPTAPRGGCTIGLLSFQSLFSPVNSCEQ